MTEKQGNDVSEKAEKEETASQSKKGYDVTEEPQAVDSVSEQLEKLTVAAKSDGMKPTEPTTGGGDDTVTSTTSS